MMTRGQVLGCIALVGAPLLVAVLWLVSGRERFTHARKIVEVLVRDEVFGDTHPEQHFVAGPIFGHYVGADALLLTVVAAALGGTAWWLVGRRRLRATARGSSHDSSQH